MNVVQLGDTKLPQAKPGMGHTLIWISVAPR